MALLDSEIARIRYELGFHVLTTEAMPYVGTVNVFEQVLQQWAEAGATTTSSTAVSSSSAGSLLNLTLASATDFSAGDKIVVDIGARQETTFVQSLSGSVVSVLLCNQHSGTYPVTVEGGESIIREILGQIEAVKAQQSAALVQVAGGQVKQVDEVQFFKSDMTSYQTDKTLAKRLDYYRNELAIACGVGSNRVKQSMITEPY